MGDAPRTPRLDPGKTFFLACREAFHDGQIEAAENEVLGVLRKELGISSEESRSIAIHARDSLAKDPPKEQRRFSRSRYLAALIHYACKYEAPADPRDEALIQRVVQCLGIDPVREEEVRAKVLADLQAADAAPAASADRAAVAPAPTDPTDLPTERLPPPPSMEPPPTPPSPEPPPARSPAPPPSAAPAAAEPAAPGGRPEPAPAPGPGPAKEARPSSPRLGGDRWAPWQVFVVGCACVLFSIDVLLTLMLGRMPKLNLLFAIGMGQAAKRMAEGEEAPGYVGKPHQVVPGAIILSLLWVVMFGIGMRSGVQKSTAARAQATRLQAAIGRWKTHLDRGAEAVGQKKWLDARASLELALEEADALPDPHERNVGMAITRYRLALSYMADIHQRAEPKFRSQDEARQMVEKIDREMQQAVDHLKRAPASYPNKAGIMKEIAGTYATFLENSRREEEARPYRQLAGG